MAGDYAPPTIEVVGSLAELTQQLGLGGGSDSQFPLLAQYASKVNDAITMS